MRHDIKALMIGALLLGPLAAFAQQPNPTVPKGEFAPNYGNNIDTAQPTSAAHSDISTTGDLPPAMQTTVRSGQVTGYTYSKKGKVNGFTLSDGTAVSVPKTSSGKITNLTQPGDAVEVSGWAVRLPGQAPQFQASRITRTRPASATATAINSETCEPVPQSAATGISSGPSRVTARIGDVPPALVPGQPQSPNDNSRVLGQTFTPNPLGRDGQTYAP